MDVGIETAPSPEKAHGGGGGQGTISETQGEEDCADLTNSGHRQTMTQEMFLFISLAVRFKKKKKVRLRNGLCYKGLE